jgi:hypothetical protein
LGVVCADFNDDGWTDIYVANDGHENFCWMNQGNKTFRNDALLAGCALNADGLAEASMGVVAADFDGDLREDLFMTHLDGETNTLYHNLGRGMFHDVSDRRGVASPSRPFTGFGTAAMDYDNDGLQDLLVANGAVTLVEALVRAKDPFPLHQTNQLYHNVNGTRFEEVTRQAGPVMSESEVSRGLACGDIDNDGDSDAVIVNNNGPARLLLNQRGSMNHWLGLKLLDAAGRDALGARVLVVRRGMSPILRRAAADGSYCSANDPRVLVGLGRSGVLEAVRVRWPSGREEQWKGLVVNQYHALREGSGEQAAFMAEGINE